MVISVTNVLAVLLGLAAIVWVNWYFLFAGRGRRGRRGRGRSQVAQAVGGMQVVNIEVAGGYAPSTIRVRPGVPVRLVFERRESAGCSEEVVLPDFGIRRFLPPFERTTVELTPQKPGIYEFACGMGMLRGRLIVEKE